MDNKIEGDVNQLINGDMYCNATIYGTLNIQRIAQIKIINRDTSMCRFCRAARELVRKMCLVVFLTASAWLSNWYAAELGISGNMHLLFAIAVGFPVVCVAMFIYVKLEQSETQKN